MTRNVSLFCPEKSAAEGWLAALILIVSFAYLYIFRRFVSLEPDEGIIVQGAARIMRGEMLYRDFFSYFTPGSYYWSALLFKVFGESMAVARTTLAVYGGLFSVFTYVMARRVASRKTSLFVVYLLILTCIPWRFFALHNWDSTLWACVALYCATRFLENPVTGWALGLGSFTSITLLFEQSKGAGLILGLGIGFLILAWLDRSRLKIYSAKAMALAAGLAWPFILTFGYFASQHALSAMLSDWFWPIHHYAGANSVPYGYQNWSGETREQLFHSGSWLMRAFAAFIVSPGFLIPVLPIIALILLVCWVLQHRGRKLADERSVFYVLVSSTLGGLLLSVMTVRSDILHFVYLGPVSYLVLAWIVEGRDLRGSLVDFIKPLFAIYVFVSFTAVGMAFLIASRSAHSMVDTRRGAVTTSEDDEILPFVQAHVPDGSKMLVYPYLPLYNFLTGTFSPTRFEYLQPGMHTREQAEEAEREIEFDRTQVVLFELGFQEKIANAWPNTPLQDIAYDPVGDYVLSHYTPCRVLKSGAGWRFVFMVLNGKACPTQ